MGGVLFAALSPRTGRVARTLKSANRDEYKIEAFDWAAGESLYSLYQGSWRPTGLSSRLPSDHDSGSKILALVTASFQDPHELGRAKVDSSSVFFLILH